MNVLFFDTETTNLPDYKAPPGRNQPHVVQLAAVLLEEGAEHTLTTLIQPEGWTIHPQSQAVHGISLERAQAEGMPIAEAMSAFDELLGRAELAVAHNVKFDRLLLDSEYVRLGRRVRWPKTFCTMQTCTDIVRIPARWGGYKWPTLEEAHRHFYGRPPAAAHDALADVRSCMAVFQALVERSLAPKA